MKRIEYIDGLKGFAALIVFMGHFFLAFLEEIHGKYSIHLPENISNILYISPLKFFVNGSFMVGLFCILSAFFTCLYVINTNDNRKLILLFPKRYLRVVLPLMPMAIGVFIISKLNLFYNTLCASITKSEWLTQFWQSPLSILSILKSVFFTAPVLGDNTVNAVLWMLPFILLGSIICIILGLNYKSSPCITYIYLIVLFCYYYNQSSLYLCAVLGSGLAVLYTKTKEIKVNKLVGCISVVFVMVGIFMGGYSDGAEQFRVYQILGNRISGWNICIIGSSFLVIGVMYSPAFQKFFSLKPFLYIGKISFSIFIIHLPVICTISSFCFIKLINQGVEYILCMLATLVITVVTVLGLSSLYYSFIEKQCSKLSVHILNKLP